MAVERQSLAGNAIRKRGLASEVGERGGGVNDVGT